MNHEPKSFDLNKILMDSPYGKVHRAIFPLLMNLPVIMLKPIIGHVAQRMLSESNAETNLFIDCFVFLSGWFFWIYMPLSLFVCYWLCYRYRNAWVSLGISLYASAIIIAMVITFFMSYVAMLRAL